MSDYKEIEAKFYFVDKEEIRKRLSQADAILIHQEAKFIRATFDPISGKSSINGTYARVRKEYNKTTMSIKSQVDHGGNMEDNQEIELVVNDYKTACDFLRSLNLKQKSHQETLRESWRLGEAIIKIDTWPWLDPYVEIESTSEADVMKKAKILGIDTLQTTVDAITYLYTQFYQVDSVTVNSYPRATFEMPCPWKKR